MKILKRILTVSFAVLVIFCIVCTSALGLSPILPDLDIDNYTLYTPVSNLETILVRSRDKLGLNDGYASLSSPYAFLEKSPTNLYLSDTSKEFFYGIGNYKPTNLDSVYTASVNIEPYSGASGAYIKETVTLVDEFFRPLDLTFVYGDSVVPFEAMPSSINAFSQFPFYTTYEFLLVTYYDYTDDVVIEVDITADLLAFDYAYDSSSLSYYFEYGPTFETIHHHDEWEVIYNDDLSQEYGMSIWEVSYTPFWAIMDRARDLMRDTTLASNSFPYTLVDSMTVSLSAYAQTDPDVEILVQEFNMVDYVYQHYNTSDIFYPPVYDNALRVFNDLFPTFTQERAEVDIDFVDFISSVMSIFNVPLIGTFTLSQLLFGIAGIGLLIWFLKMFAGG